MISSRAVALQGGGFAVALMAVQGFAPEISQVVTHQNPTNTQSIAAGSGDGAGHGYVWQNSAWVEVAKVVRLTGSMQGSGTSTQASAVVATPAKYKGFFPQGRAHARGGEEAKPLVIWSDSPPGVGVPNTQADVSCVKSMVSRYNGHCETLSMDEVMALIEAVG